MEKIKLTPQLMTEEMKKRLVEDPGVYQEIDIDASMVYILLTVKMADAESRQVTIDLVPEIKKVVDEITNSKELMNDEGKGTGDGFSFGRIWSWMKIRGSSKEEFQYLLDNFSIILQSHVQNWGFWFLKETTVTTKMK